jgi:hypothetical protein
VAESLVGFGFLAIVIGYLPVFYQAVSNREVTISLLDARAGSPPTAGELLVRLPPGGGGSLGRSLEELELWAAGVLESHLSYSVLSFYRSQHDNQSWLATLTCTIDASALVLTVAEGADRQQVRLTFAAARHPFVDLALVLRRRPVVSEVDRLPSARLDGLLGALEATGWRVRAEDAARAKLAELRGLYEPFATALAGYLRLVLPPVVRDGGRPDNGQTGAWMRRAGCLASLAPDALDDHFD